MPVFEDPRHKGAYIDRHGFMQIEWKIQNTSNLMVHDAYGFPLQLSSHVYHAHPDTSYSSGIVIDNLGHNLSGKAVLDVGCGSGVISLAAAYRGAAHVVAIDNESEAVDLARENVLKLNAHFASVVDVMKGDVLDDVSKHYPNHSFDIVAANLWMPVAHPGYSPDMDAYNRFFGNVRNVMNQDGIVYLTSADFAATTQILDAMKSHGIKPHLTTATRRHFDGEFSVEWRLYSFDRDGKPADPALWRQKNLPNTPTP